MAHVAVVTSSYPRDADDAAGHFVAAEVRELCGSARVTVLTPGPARRSLHGESVLALGGQSAFGFPGALVRIRQRPWRLGPAALFSARALAALGSLAQRDPLERIVAHFLLPCGVPIATRAVSAAQREAARARGTARSAPALDIVVHGSDARLFARLPAPFRAALGRELVRAGASLRFVSHELERLVLAALPSGAERALAARACVRPSPLDVSNVPARREARAALGIAPGARVALVAARLVAEKRVDVALQAALGVAELDCVVLGDGPERRRLAARYPRARFLGHVPRPVALAHLSAADVLVSASLEEGAPSVVREARALGTPVVALAAGDLRSWAARDRGLIVLAPSEPENERRQIGLAVERAVSAARP